MIITVQTLSTEAVDYQKKNQRDNSLKSVHSVIIYSPIYKYIYIYMFFFIVKFVHADILH